MGGSVQHSPRHHQCDLRCCSLSFARSTFFSFQKQVLFGDRPNWPDLRSDADLGEQVPPLSSHNMPHSSHLIILVLF